jgi:hypothetical protein
LSLLGRRRVVAALVVACTALAVGHALATWPHYHVGSFDDDAAYVMVARALAHGHGLTSTLPVGVPLVASYPPGYAALLAPIALVSGAAFAAFRITSVVLLAMLAPLVWCYLRRRGVGAGPALAVLLLLALNPVLGTFGMMIMADVAFLVVLMVVLLALDGWVASCRMFTWSGWVTVIGAAGLVWLKEAGAGLVIGFVLWLLVRRDRRRAVALGAGVAALFLPIVVARAVAGVNLLGSRYSNEFGSAFSGGPFHLVSHALSTYLNVAIPQTIVPTSVSPLPIFGWAAGALGTFGTLTTPLVLIGFVVWCRRHRDAMCVAVPAYVAVTLVFPFTNERRLLLILPLVVAWYVLGWLAAIGWVAAHLPPLRVVAFVAPLIALVILVPQFGRDYLYLLGHGSSQPRGSPYMRFLSQLGTPSDVVETDYVWTTSLFTGHRTAPGAFYEAGSCAPDALARGLARDRPAYLLSAALSNVPGPGSPCLLAYVASDPSAVRLFRTAFDDASVFEFVGAGTPHPGLADLTGPVPPAGVNVGIFQALPQGPGDPGGPYPIVTPVGGHAVVTWDWGRPVPVTQVSLGLASIQTGRIRRVSLELRDPAGNWVDVATSPGAVGDGGVVPFLLAHLHPSTPATAMRVVVDADADAPVFVLDAHALGGA